MKKIYSGQKSVESNITEITPKGDSIRVSLSQLKHYRGLLYMMAWRDIRVKYAQTWLGFLWAVLNPLLTLLILTFVFSKVVNVNTGEVPHILFTLCGLAAWSYFSTVFSESGQSIIGAQSMIKKIYFPRLTIPLSKAASALIDFAIVLMLLLIFLIIFGSWPSSNIIFLPMFILSVLIAGLTGGVWLSALTIRYRDFKFITPFLLQLGLYASPIAYPSSMVPEKYQWMYNLNPMVAVIEGFRWSILGGTLEWNYFFVSITILIVLFLGGVLYFLKMQRIMADII